MFLNRLLLAFLSVFIISCKSSKKLDYYVHDDDLVIAFGSCNKQYLKNDLWDDIVANQPHIWIWGGDNIYSDTDNMVKMKKDYEEQLNQKGYSNLLEKTKVLATWDDHDYGINDGGEEFNMKDESQKLFLDFIGVDLDDPRRNRKGIYHSENFTTNKGSVKVIVLDTRYFRTGLTASDEKGKRYQPNTYGKGTILGTDQWKWLETELSSSRSDFNLIVSSIQFLSDKHGFETWGNFPHEVDKLVNMIKSSKAKNVLLLSGDRHISEFSKSNIEGLEFPLIDFTSSGLTHSYNSFSSEENPFRVGDVISTKSFGILNIDFESKTITMQMRGEGNELQQELVQKY